MTSAFGLRFEALAGNGTRLDTPPAIALSCPETGPMRWRFGAGLADVYLSHPHESLMDIWGWANAVAHRLLPVRLRIGEEHACSDLYADWADEDSDTILLTLVQPGNDDAECDWISWHEDRHTWLARLGEDFDGQLLQNDRTTWEPARHLAWRWPARVAPHTTCDWPPAPRRAWFFLLLAYTLMPRFRHSAGHPDELNFADVEYRYFRLRLDALLAAWGTLLPTVFPDASELVRHLEIARHLFDGTQDAAMDCSVVPSLSGPKTRIERIRETMHAIGMAFHWLALQVEEALWAHFPISAGQWFIDECLRPGQVNRCSDRRRVMDWGEVGFSAEQGFLCGYRTTWRWPVSPPSISTYATSAVHRRWADLSASVQTVHWIVCPCCGYPQLETEPEEIMDCPVCGWPVWRVLHYPLPELDVAIEDDISGDLERWPSLSESRRYFQEHGDAFSLAENSKRTARLRQADNVLWRRARQADFDAWLADPARDERALPDESGLRPESQDS